MLRSTQNHLKSEWRDMNPQKQTVQRRAPSAPRLVCGCGFCSFSGIGASKVLTRPAIPWKCKKAFEGRLSSCLVGLFAQTHVSWWEGAPRANFEFCRRSKVGLPHELTPGKRLGQSFQEPMATGARSDRDPKKRNGILALSLQLIPWRTYLLVSLPGVRFLSFLDPLSV